MCDLKMGNYFLKLLYSIKTTVNSTDMKILTHLLFVNFILKILNLIFGYLKGIVHLSTNIRVQVQILENF